MRGARVAIVMAVGGSLLACQGILGLGDYEIVTADAGDLRPSPDASRDGDADATADAAATCAPTATCALPSAPGATLVLFGDRNPAAPCPAGWGTTDVRADPRPGPDACSCGTCQATVDCPAGQLETRHGTAACTTAGADLAVGSAGECTNKDIRFASDNVSVTAPAGRVGTCTAPATAVASSVTTAEKRFCTPTTPDCAGEACSAPPGLRACLLLAGETTCPAAAPNRTVVGDDVAVMCPACACTMRATCKGTLELFTSNGCAGSSFALVSDVCTRVPSVRTFEGYRWTPGPPATSCTKTPPAASASLTEPRTVCCP